jgi:hypothetical protein
MTPQNVEAKFLGLVGTVLGEEKARAVIDEVQALGERQSLAPLLVSLAAS